MTRKRNAAKVNAVTTGEAPWGNIETDVLSKPPENVSADASWASVIGMWLLLPLNILQAIFGALLPIVYRNYSWWAAQSVGCGRPFLLAWTWWRYVLTGLLALLLPCSGGGSRLRLFLWEWAAFGKGEYWYHGEGVWAWTYAMVDAIQKGIQARKAAFGCIAAAIPDLFPKGILIFLPNSGTSPEAEPSPAAEEKNEWWWMRRELHKIFFAGNPGYYERLQNLGPYLKKHRVVRDLSKLDDKEYLNSLVVQCVMYVIFDGYAEGGAIGATGLDRSEPALRHFPRHFRDTSENPPAEALPRHFRDSSETLPRLFREPASRCRDTSERRTPRTSRPPRMPPPDGIEPAPAPRTPPYVPHMAAGGHAGHTRLD